MASIINSPLLKPEARLYNIISNLGLTSGLVLCLDAADSASYDGSSQTWTDRAASNNFFRGTTSGSEATDPTFNGSAGGRSSSEYFSFDGGDLFKEASVLTFLDSAHKDNGACTILAMCYFVGSRGATTNIFNNAGNTDGIALQLNSSGNVLFVHSTDNATKETLTSTATITTAAWNLVAAGFNEATLAGDFRINATNEAFTPGASTCTDAHGSNYRLGGTNDTPGAPFLSGDRIACIAVWTSKLTTTQVGLIYSRLRDGRFTTLP